MLAILVKRCGADTAQLAARQHRLEHVAGIHRTLRCARAHHRMQLVNKEDDLPGRIGDLLQHRLEPLLELAAVLGARDERAQIERDEPFVL